MYELVDAKLGRCDMLEKLLGQNWAQLAILSTFGLETQSHIGQQNLVSVGKETKGKFGCQFFFKDVQKIRERRYTCYARVRGVISSKCGKKEKMPKKGKGGIHAMHIV